MIERPAVTFESRLLIAAGLAVILLWVSEGMGYPPSDSQQGYLLAAFAYFIGRDRGRAERI